MVYHVHCGSSEGEWSPFHLYYAERNRVFVNVKNAPPGQALYCLAVFAAKTLRAWLRLLTFQERGLTAWRKGLAYLSAGASLLAGLPGVLRQRSLVRGRRLVADGEFGHLVESSPPRAQREEETLRDSRRCA